MCAMQKQRHAQKPEQIKIAKLLEKKQGVNKPAFCTRRNRSSH
jgi:hypothetical protein